MSESITITLDKNTIKKLDMLKCGADITYEEIISGLADDAYLDDVLTLDDKLRIERARSEIKAGNYYTSADVAKIINEKDE